MKIAVSGKGGVGKTTVAAIWGRQFADAGHRVFLVDADPDANLAAALGVPADKRPQPLIALKDLIQDRTGADPDRVGQYFRLNPHVADLPETYSVEVAGLRLLVLGGIRGGGQGCACPQGAFLKAMLRHLMLERQEVLIADMEAGLEFLGRAAVLGTDALVAVVEPGRRSLETADAIARMGRDLGIKRFGAVLNKVTDAAQVETVRAALPAGMDLLGHVPYSPAVARADLEGRSVLGTDAAVEAALARARERLEALVATETPAGRKKASDTAPVISTEGPKGPSGEISP
ncbi:MAG: AAA family ATPase [Planctomycetes bacterium]|nr:AAA family ATPase [Planctomycetota bacterium]